MSKRKRIPFYIPALVLLLVVVVLYMLQPRPVSWIATWSKTDNAPFGGKALYELLSSHMHDSGLELSRLPASETRFDPERSINYLIIGMPLTHPSLADFEGMETITKAGGSILISEIHFGMVLQDTLGIKVNYEAYATPENKRRVNFVHPRLKAPVPYTINGIDPSAYFDSIPPGATVIARNIQNRPVTVRIPRHKGQIILNTTPYLFTNYYLLRDNNVDFAEKTLSFMPARYTIWDEFYKTGRDEPVTPIRVLLSHPGFKTAWFLFLGLILLYLLFMSKRTQRIIPVIKPYTNTTMEFTETVGRLYFNQKAHLNLARKKINFFLEKIRMRYQLGTEKLDGEFARNLALRSDIPEQDTKKLTATLHSYLVANQVSEKELQELNKLLEDFEKRFK